MNETGTPFKSRGDSRVGSLSAPDATRAVPSGRCRLPLAGSSVEIRLHDDAGSRIGVRFAVSGHQASGWQASPLARFALTAAAERRRPVPGLSELEGETVAGDDGSDEAADGVMADAEANAGGIEADAAGEEQEPMAA